MIYAQEVGLETLVEGQDAASTGSVSGYIDTRDGNYLSVFFSLGAQASTTSKPQVLKLQESDDTEATNFQDIPEMVGDDPAGFTIPDADTVNPQLVHLGLDLRGRKRYVQAVLQPGGSSQNVSVVGELSKGNTEDLQARSTLAHFA